jgi:hypothetical protein
MRDISTFSILLVLLLCWNSYVEASDLHLAANFLAAVVSLCADSIVSAVREGCGS